jgi:hypothetical protein
MAFAADYAVLYDRLDEELRFALQPTADLFAKILGGACSRIAVFSKSQGVSRIDCLIEAGAWTDAALALIELELPAWKVRRLICDGGEWICSLSRRPNLPDTLDDTVDAHHELMPLAVLSAFLEARRMTAIGSRAVTSVPGIAPTSHGTICCDNFA